MWRDFRDNVNWDGIVCYAMIAFTIWSLAVFGLTLAAIHTQERKIDVQAAKESAEHAITKVEELRLDVQRLEARINTER